MSDTANDPNEFRGEKFTYQPTPKPVAPVPAPVPPVAPAPHVYKVHEFESASDYESDYGHHHKHGEHYRILKMLHRTMTTSEKMIHLFMSTSTVHLRTRQIRLLNECSDACATSIRYISRRSPFCGRMVKMTAKVCEAYYHEYSRYPDPESQMSARVLGRCAQECRNFASMYRSDGEKTE